MMKTREEILLHSCCAPCAGACLERLVEEGFAVILFFSNSNIAPVEEYRTRLASMEKLARVYQVPLKIDVYDHLSWLDHIAGLESEPEKGARCLQCFAFSFKRAQLMSESMEMPAFTTTLSISPHKSSKVIFTAGEAFSCFKAIDFKKRNGFQRSLELSRTYHFYRQNYCGCEFSMKN